MKNLFRYFALVFSMVFFVFTKVQAKSYDIYIDADTSGTEDGSDDNPYKTISKAIEKADKGDKIYIDKGDYSENIIIDKEVNLFGEEVEGVNIKGQIEISKNVEAQDVTINGNVIIKSGADIIFNNLIITKASDIAINAYPGNGEIVIKNSTIKKAGSKGFYIQKGRDLIISGCNVYSNDEEGIDLRSNVDGTISGNNIYDNGESGIELIVSDSSLDIKNNTIKKNGASGIASQYYEDLDEDGNINIDGNTIIGNDKYGLDCGRPQGGNWPSDFWTKSIKLSGNNLKENDKGKINKECGLSQRIVKKEATEAQSEAQKKVREKEIAKNKEEKETQEQIMEQNRQKTIQENKYSLNKLVASKKELKDEVLIEKEKIENRNGLVAFLIGPNYGAIKNIKKVAPGFGEHLGQFDDLDRKLIDDKNQQIVQSEMEDIVNFVEEINVLIVEKDSKFSLLGWMFRFVS